MADNYNPILKENYGPSKKKKDEDDTQYLADGGMASDAPDFIPDNQFKSIESSNIINGTQSADVGANNKLSPSEAPDFIPDPQFHDVNEQYRTLPQTILAGLEGAARGVIGPLAPMAEIASGLTTPEAIRGREEESPIVSGVGEVAGLAGSMMTGFGEGAIAAKLGQKALAKLPLLTDSLAGKLGGAALSSAIENSVIQGSDEVSRMILQDPNQSAQTALLDVGMAGLLGGALGPVVTGVGAGISKGLEKTGASKLGQMVADFKGRMSQHINNPDPVQAVTKELSDHYSQLKDLAYDAKELQLKDIAKAMPEAHEGMAAQSNEIIDKVQSKIDKMAEQPYQYPQRLTNQLADDFEGFKAQLQDAKSPAEMFQATDAFKRQLQGWSRFEKQLQPIDEGYNFVKIAKGLSSDVREALEDNKVWGEAATRQKEINGATKEFLPALNDFEKKFTSKMEGENVIDPAKIQTYMNQIGNAKGELKQEMMGNFLGSSQKYLDQIDKIHANLGMESPVDRSSLALSRATLEEQTLGSKLADFIAHKSLAATGGHGAAAALGAYFGHMVGSPFLGALVGERVVGPFLSHTLQAITVPILNSAAKAGGLLASAEFGAAVAKGEKILDRASKAILTSGKEVLPKALFPTEKDRMKLDRQLEDIQKQPQKMLGIAGDTGDYLPGHAQSLTETAGRVSNYLSSLKPTTDPKAPLDSKQAISSIRTAEYNNALNIAQQPLIVLSKVKEGNLTSRDVAHLRAMYPDLYARMASKMTAEIATRANLGESIPYKTRIGVSLFLGQPMDSTMSPLGIQANQPMQLNQQEQQGLTKQMSRKPSQTGLNQLSKGISMVQSQGQGRALSRQKH